ncbi:carboxypeptidase-like regulatory domain-containing protein [Chitinophaga filiformis]|uniref:carboxypeptidase-like regulatory domain-containing protein n=1 Tax=Chitinophaga filiformis TaxID=104663 RepID=UPI001F48F7F3|nr:carboxypeptidase-like regulatory domain-containing protein [Chitinophaga filiformis]MCF6402275.1 carboxypeptidase-like regulatory domain-containing protein [Chitinophaga filiformis]
MKEAPIIISLPKPCHESWEEMTPAEQGRFCRSCHKTIIDFSRMSDRQIISHLNNKKEPVCGRFSEEQLNRQINIQDSRRRPPMVPSAALIAALAFSIPPTRAQSIQEKIALMANKSDITLAPQQPDTIQNNIIGIVIDSTDNSVLPAATVIIKGYKIGTKTDSSGKFELKVPDSLTEKHITLQVSHVNFITKELTVPLTNNVHHIQMTRLHDIPQGFIRPLGIIVSRKVTLWERLKNKVGMLFD